MTFPKGHQIVGVCVCVLHEYTYAHVCAEAQGAPVFPWLKPMH